MSENPARSRDFIEEWLNHLNVSYSRNYKVNSQLKLDFYLRNQNMGILIIDWKRPISVQVINRAIQVRRNLDLDRLYLVAREISEPAKKTLQKFGKSITAVHPNGLSDIAIGLINCQQPTSQVTA